MEMEYNWNDFHFHAACTFTGQLSTAEERSSPMACSITHYPLSHTCKNTFTRQCKQMAHVFLVHNLHNQDTKLQRSSPTGWVQMWVPPYQVSHHIRAGYTKVYIEVKCSVFVSCTNSDESNSTQASCPCVSSGQSYHNHSSKIRNYLKLYSIRLHADSSVKCGQIHWLEGGHFQRCPWARHQTTNAQGTCPGQLATPTSPLIIAYYHMFWIPCVYNHSENSHSPSVGLIKNYSCPKV